MATPLADLDVVADFLNTLDEREFTIHGAVHAPGDQLTSPDALTDWLAGQSLEVRGRAAEAEDLRTALALRTALRTSIDADDAEPVARALEAFPLRLAPSEAGGLRLVASTGLPGLDVIVEAAATAVTTGRWGRVKLCASGDCRWAFHDTSRSGSGRWCTMEICGNRHKTRAYRRRRADG